MTNAAPMTNTAIVDFIVVRCMAFSVPVVRAATFVGTVPGAVRYCIA